MQGFYSMSWCCCWTLYANPEAGHIDRQWFGEDSLIQKTEEIYLRIKTDQQSFKLFNQLYGSLDQTICSQLNSPQSRSSFKYSLSLIGQTPLFIMENPPFHEPMNLNTSHPEDFSLEDTNDIQKQVHAISGEYIAAISAIRHAKYTYIWRFRSEHLSEKIEVKF